MLTYQWKKLVNVVFLRYNHQGSHSDWKKGQFFSQGISHRLEKLGKITQITGKVWEFQINVMYYF